MIAVEVLPPHIAFFISLISKSLDKILNNTCCGIKKRLFKLFMSAKIFYGLLERKKKYNIKCIFVISTQFWHLHIKAFLLRTICFQMENLICLIEVDWIWIYELDLDLGMYVADALQYILRRKFQWRYIFYSKILIKIHFL